MDDLDIPLLNEESKTLPPSISTFSEEENAYQQTPRDKQNKQYKNFLFDQHKRNHSSISIDESYETQSFTTNPECNNDMLDENLASNLPNSERSETNEQNTNLVIEITQNSSKVALENRISKTVHCEIEKFSVVSCKSKNKNSCTTLYEFINSDASHNWIHNSDFLALFSAVLCFVGYAGIIIQVLAYSEIDTGVIFNLSNDFIFVLTGLSGFIGLVWPYAQNCERYYKVLFRLIVVSLIFEIINCLTSVGLAFIFFNVIIGCNGDDCDYLTSAGISGLIMAISMSVFNLSLIVLILFMIPRFLDSKRS